MAHAEPVLPMPVFDKPVKLLIVAAPYEGGTVAGLVAGAKERAALAGVEVEMVEVPGALEVPSAIGMAERLAQFDGYVALACVMRVDAGPGDLIAAETFHALSLMGLQGLCIGNGILTVDSDAGHDLQAQRHGAGAVDAALHLVAISRKWAAKTKGIGFRA